MEADWVSQRQAVREVERWLYQPAPMPLTIATSGSTGEPKRVLLSRDALVASAQASAARLHEQGWEPGPWSLLLPVNYVAGINVIVRSHLAGHDPVPLAQAAYTSLVSTQLQRMLDNPDELELLRNLRCVLVGGGPVPAPVRQRAAELGVTVMATYGATETSGGCVYDGLALDGVDVSLTDDGLVAIDGPMLMDGYADEPPRAGPVVMPDVGELDDNGRLTILGRADDMIITGGVKVPGPAVEALLAAHPDVTAVAVVGVDDPEWGQAVAAVVVGTLDLASARDWVSADRPRAWAPHRLVQVEALPVLANGKVDRLALQELARG